MSDPTGKGVSAEIIGKLNAGISAALADPKVAERLTTLGFDPAPPGPPAQFDAFIRSELSKWRNLAVHVKFEFN